MKNSKNDKKHIINCAGEKVFVDDNGFTSRCAVGNTDDYLESFKDHIDDKFISLGNPSLISVVIPSYATTEHDLSQVLLSLCSQEYPVSAEILLFINEPANAPENFRVINDENERFVKSVQKKTVDEFSPVFLETYKVLIDVLSKNKGNVSLKCVRQIMEGGLPNVYQVIMTSLTARVRAFCDGITEGEDHQKRIDCIEEYFQHSMLLLCDDDLVIKGVNAISSAYKSAISHNAVVLGKLKIKSVDTTEKYKGVLQDLMQLFLDFKYDNGLNFLTPRGMVLSDVLRVGGINVCQPFADQLFFASVANKKTSHLIEASTSIGESDHPGNGNFLKRLRLYLEGEENDALSIFENVLKRYKENSHKGRFCPDDIKKLLEVMKTRDIDKISLLVKNLLAF